MQNAFLSLHLSILLAGTTGVFGKLINLSPMMIVWWRALIAGLALYAIVRCKNLFEKCSTKEIVKYVLLGIFLSYQWMLFYASIKASNISVGVVTFSTVGFFTAILEPLILKSRFSVRELLLSLLTILGVFLIFSFDARYRLGICYGVISAAGAALVAIYMKAFRREHNATTVLTWQFAGAFIGSCLILPFYFYFSPETAFVPPTAMDAVNLAIFATVVTLGMYLLQMVAFKQISAFTVNLSYNLEPVYSILIAIVFLGEAKELNASFWMGLGLIGTSVVLQTLIVMRQRK